MLKSIAKKILGSQNERELQKFWPRVEEINQECQRLEGLSEDDLKGQTEKFRAHVQERARDLEDELAGFRERRRRSESAAERESLSAAIGSLEDDLNRRLEEALDEILVEAFATVKEACRRLLGSGFTVTGQETSWDMVPYDVQLLGGVVLHQGKVAEMATGEGKTLVATLPLYLNSLTGRGAHLVTVNSYLAQRDSEWMGHLFGYLGLGVGCIDLHQPGSAERRAAYAADITYGTNNEFGFDYLRDNMVHSLEQRVQRSHQYAIIDEVDSVLIDEARTPLIISGPVGSKTNQAYARYKPAVTDLYRRQSRMVGEILAEAEKAIAGGDEATAGEKLLLAKRGTPKNKKLLKLFAEDPSLQKLANKTEGLYMRDKRLSELEEGLLFSMDEKGHNVHLTDRALDILSPDDHEAFVIPDLSEALHEVEHDPSLSLDEKRSRREELEQEYADKSERMHVIHQLLKAYTLFQRDEQYVVQDGQVVIVDEFTGRMMPGRRWSDGLHQAVEAKEEVSVQGETQTLATVTIQNYFRMYAKLAGMTGTAETEEAEFGQIYGLDVRVIPTNRPIVRDDRDDLIFRTKREKYSAMIEEIGRLHGLELPVLVGTVNVDVSETLSRMLKRRGIPHEVLNAKQHAREAQIVARAGQPCSVTIATNMAGRGTDIKLGPGVTESRAGSGDDNGHSEFGGLHIVGSERHESRRIDRQLRGRAGRQGDPGATQFFLSLEDDLMRLFNSDRIASVMTKLGAEEGEVITHPLVTRSIGRAQQRVETQHFESRKRLLDYDDVMNQQREVVYDLRSFALEGGEELKGEVWEMIEKSVGAVVDRHAPVGVHPEEWDLSGLREEFVLDYFLTADRLPRDEGDGAGFDGRDELEEYLLETARQRFHEKIDDFGEHRDGLLRFIVLSAIDEKWKDHLYDLDHLKASIGFRGWGQKDPLIEYKKEAFEMFVELIEEMQSSVAKLFFRARLSAAAPPRPPRTVGAAEHRGAAPGESAGTAPGPARRPEPVDAGLALGVNPARAVEPAPERLVTNRGDTEPRKHEPVTAVAEPGRNDPCPCGSGKKYKKCCGRVA
ncbi:MAG: preprotein translocase subunit SecA [Longimicrobiaceae bacterium]